MIGTLLKKQFLEMFSPIVNDRKTGKRRKLPGLLLYILLFLFVFASMAFYFGILASSLGDSLLNGGFMAGNSGDWIYFAMMGMMSVAAGTLLSMFSAAHTLFSAGDNETLLAMPIPPHKILVARMTSLYVINLIYSAAIWLPTVIIYCCIKMPTEAVLIFCLLLLFLIPMLETVLASLFGFPIAFITSRSRNKNIITVVLSVVFFVGYYYVCFNLNGLLTSLVASAGVIGEAIRAKVWPLYQLGKAAAGDPPAMLKFALMTIGLFALCCGILSRGFLSIATMNRGMKRVAYVEKTAKEKSALSALLQREFLHLGNCAIWMINGGFGAVVLLAAAVYAIVKRDLIRAVIPALLAAMGLDASMMIPAVVTAAIGMVSAMNAFSASSVSLEGKNLWIVQSLPVDPAELLTAKVLMHTIINGIPVLIASVVIGWITGLSIPMILLVTLTCEAYVLLNANVGLVLNLLMPNLTWTSEQVPVKQGMPVCIVLFGGWAVAALIGFGGYFLQDRLSGPAYIALLLGLICILAGLSKKWLNKKGVAILEKL